MPFLGLLNGNTVIPEEVEDGVSVRCLECNNKMTPRGPYKDGSARHFHHPSSTNGNCSGGESDPHRKMKSIAISTLRQQFPNHTRCNAEISLDTTETATLPDTRRADTLLEFETPNRYFGNGIIIEIQYKNHGKDLFATTHDYLSLGYSVYWATPDDFDNNRLLFTLIETKFNNKEDNAYATYHHEPDDFSTEIAASLLWEDPTNCDHSWQELNNTSPKYESCPHCGTNRYYDEQRAQYLYDDSEILGQPAEPTTTTSDTSNGCTPNGHVWEPDGDGVSRCGVCNSRKVQLNNDWGTEPREIILPMHYMGKNITELTSNPENCTHSWNHKNDTYHCEQCGLIDHMPY